MEEITTISKEKLETIKKNLNIVSTMLEFSPVGGTLTNMVLQDFPYKDKNRLQFSFSHSFGGASVCDYTIDLLTEFCSDVRTMFVYLVGFLYACEDD